MSFESLNLHSDLLRGLAAAGFTTPTPIQQTAIPAVLTGRDVVACAVTGSGKTAAYLLPTIQRLMGRPPGIRALVLAPTRELAAQIDAHRQILARPARVTGAAIFGGVAMGPQEQALRRGVSIVVATPGRLLDHMRQAYARLGEIEVLVLDEVDRMLDMGFLPDIRRILGRLPAERQTLMFSATLPPPIAALAREMLRKPITIDVERPAAPAARITHTAYAVASEGKATLLLDLLHQNDLRSVLAFTRTKHRADRLAKFLARHGVASERIHGNRSQAQRTAALAGFRSRRYRVLVATDVAARGIDVEGVSHVVNVDVPGLPEDYLHRVGRTARAQASGTAVTFIAPGEEATLRTIERALGTRIARAASDGPRPESVGR